MLRYIAKKIHYSQIMKENIAQQDTPDKTYSDPILPDLKKNLENLRNILSNSGDVVIREFNFGQHRQVNGALIFLNGMVNKDVIHKNILQPLMYDTLMFTPKDFMNLTNVDNIMKNVLTVSDMSKVSLINDLLDNLLSGNTILLVDSSKEALVINTKEWKSRNVEQPLTEGVVRGPREGFTGSLNVNTTLLRRKIKDPDLCMEILKIGDKTKTEVCIAYHRKERQQ